MIYGGFPGQNPYQALFQQLQGMPQLPPGISPQQMLALQSGSGMRDAYGINSPYAAIQRALGAFQQPAPMPPPQMNPYGNTNPYQPGGVTDQVRRMQGLPTPGFLPSMLPMQPAMQPQIGQWSSQGPMAQPFSPLRNEGYRSAGFTPNRFTAQNQTRGMSGGPITNPFRARPMTSPMSPPPAMGSGMSAAGGLSSSLSGNLDGMDSGPFGWKSATDIRRMMGQPAV